MLFSLELLSFAPEWYPIPVYADIATWMFDEYGQL